MENFIDLSKAEIKEEKEGKRLLVIVGALVSFSILLLFFLLFTLSNKKLTSPLQNQIKDVQSTDLSIQKVKEEENGQHIKEVVGFLPSWAVSQKANVNTKSLTQLIYFGLGVNSNGELIQYAEDLSPVLEWHYFTSEYFTEIRDRASRDGVKVLISIKNFDNENIDNLVSSNIATDNFIKNLLSIIKKYNLDGVNLDFEYVTDSNFPTSKYLNGFLVKLSQTLKKENPNFIISVDVNATAVIKDSAYDMVKIGEIADFVILMGYDYRTAKSIIAGPSAPLFAKTPEDSIEKSVNSLIGRVPPEKIILAVPFYGYEWQTINKSFKSPAIENTGALATYKRVKELIKSRKDIEMHWDKVSKTPWLSYVQSGAIKQIYFENDKSFSEKLKFIKEQNLAGIGIWSLGYEGDSKDLWEVILGK